MNDTTFDEIESILGEFQIVDAIYPDGHRSHGTVRFEPHGIFAHSHSVIDHAKIAYGLAAIFRGRLLVASGPKDKVEIGAYYLSGNRLEGIWVPPGAKGTDLSICGRELSHRVQPGTFEIEKAYAIDQLPYTGKLKLNYLDPESQHVRRVKFNWSLNDGEYASFGLACGEILVSTFNFEPNEPCSIALYEPHLSLWRGTIAHSTGDGVSRETLKR